MITEPSERGGYDHRAELISGTCISGVKTPEEERTMFAAQIVDCFIICSFLGWIYECIYCTCKEGHWQNRGFLYGPICPIYGSGVVAALIVFRYLAPGLTQTTNSTLKVFLICAAGSAVLEFVTSWVLEQFFHALWWDYSDIPFNIQGRICLPATTLFGIAGVLVVRCLIPFMISLPIDEHPIINEILSIGFALILGMDLALTVASLTRILERMESVEHQFNVRMEAGYQTFQQGPAAVGSAAVAAAQNVGETAAIATMLATDSAKAKAGNMTETAAIAAMLATDSAKAKAENMTETAAITAMLAADSAKARVENVTESARTKAQNVTESAAIAAMLATDTARLTAETVTETAAITARIAADNARAQAERSSQEMAERVRLVMQNLTGRERYHLRSIRTYRPVLRKGDSADMSDRLRALFNSVQRDAGRRQVRGTSHDEERSGSSNISNPN